MSKSHQKHDMLSPVSSGMATRPTRHKDATPYPQPKLIYSSSGLYRQYSSFLARQFKASDAFVFLNEETQSITNPRHLTAESKRNDTEALAKEICTAVAEIRNRLVINDTNSHPLVQKMAEQSKLSFGAFVGMPIYLGHDDVIGTICVVDQKIRYWTTVQIDFIASIANEIKHSLERDAGSSKAQYQA